jgi:hypothetical protein
LGHNQIAPRRSLKQSLTMLEAPSRIGRNCPSGSAAIQFFTGGANAVKKVLRFVIGQGVA